MRSAERIIKLRKVGEIEGYYRTYYKDDETGRFYALTDFRGMRDWNTTACNGGEPDMPLKDGVVIEIYNDDRFISRERIKRMDDCTSRGIMEVIENE